jgi:hypothetical protein
MRNKKALLGIALALIGGLLLMLAVIAIRSTVDSENGDGDSLFGNTTTVREPLPEPDESEVDVRGEITSWGNGSENQSGIPVLRMLSKEPVAGATGVLVETSGYAPEEYVRFIERSTGFVKDVRLERVEDPVLVRNDTMLRIGRVYWSRNGTTTLIQRLDTDGVKIYSYLTTFGLLFAPPTATTGTSTEATITTIPGRHLEFDAVITAAVSPDAASLFYIVRTDSGSVGYIESVVLGTRREVWRSPLRSVTARWDARDAIVIYTNPSSEMTGHLWLLNPATGASTLTLGDEYALAARMDSTGARLLYSIQEKGSSITSLRVLTLQTGAVTFLPPEVSAPVEKCAWGTRYQELVYCAVPRNSATLNYLEQWYLGVLSSDDVLWQINTATGEAHLILDPVELTTHSFDIVDLEVSPLGDFLTFKTKQDDILWATTIPTDKLPTTPAVDETPEPETTL